MYSKLAESYKNTTYKLDGHGARDMTVLKNAFDSVDSNTRADAYGNGAIINDFEAKMAHMLGKEKAVFFPSGTMAQQIALRMWCDEKEIHQVAYHPLCHLELYEEDGLKVLHPIESVLLGEKDRMLTLKDLMALDTDISTLVIELPQRGIGGQCPTWDELNAILDYCKKKGIKTHLDGARLWEVSPYYDKSVSDICAGFDSVYVSFYKGLGGIAGAILAGPDGFMEKSKVWKRRYGGDLISLYPYIVSAAYYLDQRLDKMPLYYEQAKVLAGYYNRMKSVYTVPEIPVSNMFHVYFHEDAEEVVHAMVQVMDKYNVGITPYIRENKDQDCMFEMAVGDAYQDIPKETIEACLLELDTILST